MRPASRRALLERLARPAPRRGRTGWVVALAAVAVLVAVFFLQGPAEQQRTAALQERGPPVVDAVLAPPFGEGSAAAPTPPVTETGSTVDALRVAYRTSTDQLALYRQWRLRPEAEARYLAYRAARDCELVLGGGEPTELDAVSERRGERERQMVFAAARCRGFLSEPALPDELQRLLHESAAAGHPAALVALATEAFLQGRSAETMAVLQRALASADPLAFDEARLLLAMGRHRWAIAGVAPGPEAEVRRTDARVLAIDLAGCRLGNPCGPGRGAVAIDCGDSAPCRRDAEEWVMQLSELGEEDRRAALALAERIVGAFKRGAIDEIVRAPSASAPVQ